MHRARRSPARFGRGTLVRVLAGDAGAVPDRVDRTRLTVAIGPLLAPVLRRVIGSHAARAKMTLDRFNDAVLVADAVAAGAPATVATDRLPVSVRSGLGWVELRVGPLSAGIAERLLAATALPRVGAIVERLADTVHVREGAGGAEYLVVRVDGAEAAAAASLRP